MNTSSRGSPLKTRPASFLPAASNTALALLQTSRPIGWLVSVGLFRIGMAYGNIPDRAVTIALTVALSMPFGLYLFGINDLADQHSDRLNPRKGTWLHGARLLGARQRQIRTGTIVSACVLLGLALMLPTLPAAVLVTIVALGWAYSMRPLRLKEVPLADGLTTAAIMIGLLGLGYWVDGSWREVPAESYAVVPTLASLHIFGTVVDEPSDRAAGHRTLAVRIGPRRTLLVAFAMSLLGLATVFVLSYAWPIALYIGWHAAVLGCACIVPRHVTYQRALWLLGTAGALTIVLMTVI